MTRVNLLSAADAATLLCPTIADRSMLAKGKSISGTPVFTQSSTAYRGGYRSLTNIPDFVEFEEVLAAGTYTLSVEFVGASSGGTVNFTIDGAGATAIDTYLAASTPTRAEFGPFAIATSGKHLIRFTNTTKNAASSSTTSRLSGYTLTRTGA